VDPIYSASWISAGLGDVCPVFKKKIECKRGVQNADLFITAFGVYEAELNGRRVGAFFMAPGWTSYHKRLQYQQYDVTDLLKKSSELRVTLGKGWCVGRIAWGEKPGDWGNETALLACLRIRYDNGDEELIPTDATWEWAESPVRFSEIYDGETYDARVIPADWKPAMLVQRGKEVLLPQEGEIVCPQEVLRPVGMLTTPKGETVLDFGQNLTGYVRFTVCGEAGDEVRLSHAEVLDHDGNFYTENLRSAKNEIRYLCGGGEETYHPHFCFQGFRYVRIDCWPGNPKVEDFQAVVVHSQLERTGEFECSNPLLNQLYRNIIWGQKGNFLDVPTDCPQRDERLGWTGDAEVFARAASYNFNVLRFFKKWLHDLQADQLENGGVPHVIPNVIDGHGSAAWGDAAVICPWQMYLTYGDRTVLEDQFESMRRWVEYIRSQGTEEALWNTGEHFGDWLGLDAQEGSYKGSTSEPLIATAYFAYSTSLLVKAGKALGRDMSEYEALYGRIVEAFRREFIQGGKMACDTQTAHVLALYFNLAAPEQKPALAARLAQLVHEHGDTLTTGFVGTPYLLYALADNGYLDLAYTLLLQEKFPSWLFSVRMGATTIWEHWDGVKEDGSMWSKDMNSFNHYAYGAVADFLYSAVAGINPDETQPGYRHILLRPRPDNRLEYARASLKTAYGTVCSGWKRQDGGYVFDFDIPEGCTATLSLGDEERPIGPGHTCLRVSADLR
jgi:alpha-L-rhamnosidase